MTKTPHEHYKFVTKLLRFNASSACCDVYLGLQAGDQQKQPTQFAVNEQAVNGRGVPELAVFAELKAFVANSRGQVGVAKIKTTLGAKRFAGQIHQVKYQLPVVGLRA